MSERVTIPFNDLAQAEERLGFSPYVLDDHMEITEEGEVLIPNDIRARIIGRGALNGFALNEIRHLHALRNLELHNSAELEVSNMRDYQQEVIRKIENFLRYPEEDENGEPIQAGYIKLPTATGKTAIFAHTVGEISKPVGDRTQPLKTLVLVPGRDLVEQTVGKSKNETDGAEEMIRGFAKFAPHMNVTEYHGGRKDLGGDVVVMTYQSLIRAMRQGRFDPNIFDAVVLDEVHRALGATTKQYVKKLIQDKISIGFSATTEYGANKKVADLLPTEIMRMELREAVDAGYLAPMRCWAVGTNEKIVAGGRGDITEEEMQKLITSEFRNNAAIKFAQEFIQNGQQGIISCVAGQNLRHAREIAERLNKESVIDAHTGEIRNIKAIAVHGEMTIKERRDIYEAYERGETDVLTTVDLLNEGWDSTAAKFLINLRPTTSSVLGTQRIGRVLRPSEDGQIATIVEFIDDIEKPGDNIFTFYNAMDEREIIANKVYGRPSRPGSPEIDIPEPRELSPELWEIVSRMEAKLLEEMIFGVDGATEDDKALYSAAKSLQIAPAIFAQFANEIGITGTTKQRSARRVAFYSPEEIARVGEYMDECLGPLAIDGYMATQAAARSMNLNHTTFHRFSTELGISGQKMRRKTGSLILYSPQEVQRVSEYVDSILGPVAPNDYVAIQAAARSMNASWQNFQRVAAEIGIIGNKMRRGISSLFFAPNDVKRVAEYLDETLGPIAPEGHLAATDASRTMQMSIPLFTKLAAEIGISGSRMRRHNQSTIYFTPEDVKRINDYADEVLGYLAPDNYMAAAPASATMRIEYTVFHRLRTELNIRGRKMRRMGQSTLFFSPEEIQQVSEYADEELGLVAPDNYIAAAEAARSIGMSVKVFQRLRAQANIEGQKMRRGGKSTLFFSPEEIQQVKAHRPYY